MTVKTLIVSDLDGTLMRDDGQVSEYSKSVIRRLLAEGHLFTVASARSLVSIRRIFSDLDIQLPVVSYNGAVITHLKSSDYESVSALDVSVFRELIRIIDDMGLEPFVSTYSRGAEHRYFRKIRNEGMNYVMHDLVENRDRRLVQVEDFAQAMQEPLLEVNVIGTAVEAEAFYNRLQREIGQRVGYVRFESRYQPGSHWVSLASPMVSKAFGCEKLVLELGLKAENLLVFGDEDNDKKMFEYAGHAVATANAILPVKALASEVIGHCNEDAVARYLAKRFLGE
ncbi:MAG TPA: HAD family hydrolase [Bdellovibrionota bacterium]|jgi:Cof subfamily protein (haloacid dehalogenase superfamily)|nr:HAD family hydrolase [Bdellovibrionota bacterium]